MLWLLPIVLTYLIIWIFPKWFQSLHSRKTLSTKQKTTNRDNSSERFGVRKSWNLMLQPKNKKRRRWRKPKRDRKIDPHKNGKVSTKISRLSLYFPSFNPSSQRYMNTTEDFDIWLIQRKIFFQIPKDILAYSQYKWPRYFDKTKESIELTEKGKLFVRQYSTDTTPSF